MHDSGLVVGVVFGAMQSIEYGEVIGYASMIIGMAFVFVGVSQKRKLNNGLISFKEALLVGLYIAGIASLFYVVSWLIIDVDNNFIEQYEVTMMASLKESGATAEEIASQQEQMDMYKEWSSNIFLKGLITFMEIAPVALLTPFVAAFILKKK